MRAPAERSDGTNGCSTAFRLERGVAWVCPLRLWWYEKATKMTTVQTENNIRFYYFINDQIPVLVFTMYASGGMKSRQGLTTVQTGNKIRWATLLEILWSMRPGWGDGILILSPLFPKTGQRRSEKPLRLHKNNCIDLTILVGLSLSTTASSLLPLRSPQNFRGWQLPQGRKGSRKFARSMIDKNRWIGGPVFVILLNFSYFLLCIFIFILREYLTGRSQKRRWWLSCADYRGEKQTFKSLHTTMQSFNAVENSSNSRDVVVGFGFMHSIQTILKTP